MKYRAITTMNAVGWHQSGERMVATYERNWPLDVELTVYAEGFDVPVGAKQARLPAWFDEFKARHVNNRDAHGLGGGTYKYRRDCVKFAHKVAALCDAAEQQDDGVLIWLDADIVTHEAIDRKWLKSLFPSGYMAWLDRDRKYPECGFVMYRCSHPGHREFMRRLRAIYETDAVFALPETHDSFVVQQIALQAVADGLIEKPSSLSGDASKFDHPLVAGPLGSRLDHLKGARKARGRSLPSDTKGRRTEAYWRS